MGLGRQRRRAERSCSEGGAAGHLLARETMALTLNKRRLLEGACEGGTGPGYSGAVWRRLRRTTAKAGRSTDWPGPCRGAQERDVSGSEGVACRGRGALTHPAGARHLPCTAPHLSRILTPGAGLTAPTPKPRLLPKPHHYKKAEPGLTLERSPSFTREWALLPPLQGREWVQSQAGTPSSMRLLPIMALLSGRPNPTSLQPSSEVVLVPGPSSILQSPFPHLCFQSAYPPAGHPVCPPLPLPQPLPC